MAKNFKDLSEAEILALTISNEETDAGVYEDFATRLRDNYPATPSSLTDSQRVVPSDTFHNPNLAMIGSLEALKWDKSPTKLHPTPVWRYWFRVVLVGNGH